MKKEYLLLFVILSLISFSNISNLCKLYIPLTYDNQIYLAWSQSAALHLLPYKDIFYPYGILSYYKEHNIFFSILYYLFTPLFLTYLYYILSKLFKDKLFAYISIGFLFLFIYTYSGFEVFTRFGVLVMIGCLYSYILYSHNKKIVNKKVFIAAILNGLILPLFNDQGIFAVGLFFTLLFIDFLLRRSAGEHRHIIDYLTKALVFFTGIIVGSIPFLIYLIFNGSLIYFFQSIIELADLTLFSKTPFFHSIGTPENIFTITVLVFSIFHLTYRLYYLRQKPTLHNYIEIAVVLVLIILEQKNITRSADKQLTFIGVFLFIILFSEFKMVLIKHKLSHRKIVSVYLLLSIILLFFTGFQKAAHVSASGTCFSGQLNLAEYNIKKYQEVKDEITTIKDFNGKIFSFPGDTIFYVLFKQPMPYYPTSYEASSINAQKKMIQYIETNNINIIIYNYKNHAIQDEVPNYIRSAELHSYIINNFAIYKKTGEYIILKRAKKTHDFFDSSYLNELSDFRNYLLSVNFANIPKSEGEYKSKYLSKNTKIIIHANSLKQFNESLKNKPFNTRNTLLVMNFNNTNIPVSDVTLKTQEGKVTKITFYTCKYNKPCILNLSHVPLFNKVRNLEHLSTSNPDDLKSINLLIATDENYY